MIMHSLALPPAPPAHGRKMSVCTDNVTDLRIPEGESGFSKPITAYVCQAIIIPPEVTGYKAGVSSQPVSLADRLIGEYLRLSHLFECVSV